MRIIKIRNYLVSTLYKKLTHFIGYCFEMEKLVEHVKSKGKHPISGIPMALKDIFPLRFTRDKRDNIICPVSLKELNDKVKVAAIKTSRNVFRYQVLENMNKKVHFWKDLVNSTCLFFYYLPNAVIVLKELVSIW